MPLNMMLNASNMLSISPFLKAVKFGTRPPMDALMSRNWPALTMFKANSDNIKPITDTIFKTSLGNLNPITDTYWPAFKRAVQDDVDKVRPIELTCALCKKPMTLTRGDNDSLDSSHVAWIIPCGHMVGASCLERLYPRPSRLLPDNIFEADFYTYNGQIECPFCNTKIENHSQCGHRCPGQQIPRTATEYAHIPPVLSESGEIYPTCGKCEFERVAWELNCLFKDYINGSLYYDRNVESETQYVALCLDSNRGEPIYRSNPPMHMFQLLHYWPQRNIDKGILAPIWTTYKQAWMFKCRSLWFLDERLALYDLHEIDLHICLMDYVYRIPH